MADTNNQNSFLDYAGLALFWSNIKKIIEDNELVTATALTDLDTRVDTLEGLTSTPIISKTYSELKTLRDNSQLIPGQQYRITDYQTVSNQENTDVDGRRFDIIVTADNEYTLNETARAVHHEGCDDFKDENLDVWEIKYTIDNSIYSWGNGGDRIESTYTDFFDEYEILSIIGEDKIEYGYDGEIYGECTIDKSQTYTIGSNEYYKVVDESWYYVPVNYSVGDWVIVYSVGYNVNPGFITTITRKINDDVFYKLDTSSYYVSSNYNIGSGIYEYYTDCYDDYEIVSIIGEDKIEYGYAGEEPYGAYTIDKSQTYNIDGNEYYKVVDNSVNYVPVNYSVGDYVLYYEEYMASYYDITNITNFPSTKGTIYYMKDEYYNECPYDFKCIRFLKENKYVYTFGKNCMHNIIKPYYMYETYRLNCIILTNWCSYNTFGSNCYNNTFDNSCSYNTFGSNCYNNTFGNSCIYNTFGSNCYNNTFGNSCSNNTFDSSCYYNTFGAGSTSNTFGNSFISNTFLYARHNSFGNNCSHNSAGDSFIGNSFGNNCQYNSFRLSASYSGTLLNYCYYNHFDDGCSYNIIYSTTQGTNGNRIKNYNINRGVSGTSYGNPMIIEAKYFNAENVCNVYKKGDVAVVGYIQY